MGELITKVIPLSLGAAVSPTVLGIALLILSAPNRPVARGVSYTAGVTAVLGGVTVVGLAITRHVTAGPRGLDPVTRAIDGTIGGVLILLALATVLRAVVARKEAAPPAAPAEPAKHTGLPSAFVLGAAMMMANFSTILLYLPAMRAVSSARVDVADKAAVVAIAMFITLLPATLPLTVRLVAPGPSTRWFTSLHDVVQRHQRQIAIVIEVVFGVYLLAKAF